MGLFLGSGLGWLFSNLLVITPGFSYPLALIIKLGLMLLSFAGLVLAIRATAGQLANALLVLASMFAVLYVAEFALSLFPSPNANDKSLHAWLWHKLYWQAGEDGIRESGLGRDDGANIVFIGDSFTAGIGVEDPSQRFPELVQQALPQTRVSNISMPGWQVTDYLAAVDALGPASKLVYLGLVPNDIEGVLDEAVIARKQQYLKSITGPLFDHGPAFRFLFRHSFLVNEAMIRFAAWYVWRRVDEIEDIHDYLASEQGRWHTTAHYLDPQSRQRFQDTLELIRTRLSARGAELRLIFFPLMKDRLLGFTEEYCNRPFYSWVESEGIRAIRVTPLLAELSESRRTASSMDAHPDERVHALVAEAVIADLRDSPPGAADE